MHNKNNLSRHINVRVPERIYEECSKIAVSYSMTVSSVARLMLMSAVDTLKDDGALPKIKREVKKKGK